MSKGFIFNIKVIFPSSIFRNFLRIFGKREKKYSAKMSTFTVYMTGLSYIISVSANMIECYSTLSSLLKNMTVKFCSNFKS